jgi:adenylate kinase
MRNIVMIGPQGSGKGTQGDILARQLGMPIVSLGQLLRAETERETGLGRDIKKYLEDGEMVPSEIIYHLILDRMREQDTDGGVILDGYPRSEPQAETLDEILTKLDRQVTHAFYLDVPDDISISRISGRRVCSNTRCGANYHIDSMPPKKQAGICDKCGSELKTRDDDTPETVKHRLELFHAETAPLHDFYERRGLLHDIDATQSIEAVNAALLKALGEEPKPID